MRERDAFAAVARRIVPAGELRGYRRLEGGVSASTHALEIEGPDGREHRVVVRRHHSPGWKGLEEGVTAMEHALLAALLRMDLPVPVPRALDESGRVLPSPYYAMDWVEGSTVVSEQELPAALSEMAAFLARLHAIDVDRAELPPLPEREDPCEGALEYLPSEGFGDRLRAVLESSAEWRSRNPSSLVHGDFWPGNVLWHEGRLVAVLDWEDAALGDPLSDLACCRVELLCAYGEPAMRAFTAHYCELSEVDLADLPFWEVYVSAAALSNMAQWGLDPEAEAERRRRTTRFLERASRELMAEGLRSGEGRGQAS